MIDPGTGSGRYLLAAGRWERLWDRTMGAPPQLATPGPTGPNPEQKWKNRPDRQIPHARHHDQNQQAVGASRHHQTVDPGSVATVSPSVELRSGSPSRFT